MCSGIVQLPRTCEALGRGDRRGVPLEKGVCRNWQCSSGHPVGGVSRPSLPNPNP